jgi:MoxR-like ATPase
MTERFAGTERYIATDDLMMAVNAAVTLARPLLIKGRAGHGQDPACPGNCALTRQADV